MVYDTVVEFFEYHRKFHSVAISLLTNKALLNSDKDHYFWQGLHENVQRAVSQHIENMNKDYNHLQPITIEDVTKAAKYIFSDNMFKKDKNDPIAINIYQR